MQIVDVLTLQAGYTTAVVSAGVTLLGIGAGVVGGFALLRKRALMGDALAHATLPGVVGAFLVMVMLRAWLGPEMQGSLPEAKSLLVLLIGASVSALLGVGCVNLIRRSTNGRVPEEAAIGVVLSVFFGIGTVLLSVVQAMATSGVAMNSGSSGGGGGGGGGGAAGLKTFIFGQPAAMSVGDAMMLGGVSLCAIVLAIALFKEFRLVCFDDGFAKVQGWPVHVLDALMMAMVVSVTVVGLQSVGLVLVVALLIVPAAAARFWTHRLGLMLVISGVIGGVSGYIGVAISALAAGLPAGAIVVLVATAMFIASAIFAPESGLVSRIIKRSQLARKVRLDHALRSMYELMESRGDGEDRSMDLVIAQESLRRIDPGAIGMLKAAGYVRAEGARLVLSESGLMACRAAARNHRLWEQYLVTRASMSTTHVDRAADLIEHVLDADLVRELSRELEAKDAELPASVHPIGPSAGGSKR